MLFLTSLSTSDASCFFFFQAEDGIRDIGVTGVQTCALPIFAFEFREHLRVPRLCDEAAEPEGEVPQPRHPQMLAELEGDAAKDQRKKSSRSGKARGGRSHTRSGRRRRARRPTPRARSRSPRPVARLVDRPHSPSRYLLSKNSQTMASRGKRRRSICCRRSNSPTVRLTSSSKGRG